MASNSDRRSGSSGRSSRDPLKGRTDRGRSVSANGDRGTRKRTVEINTTREVSREGRSAAGSRQQRQREAGMKDTGSRGARSQGSRGTGRGADRAGGTRGSAGSPRTKRADVTELQKASRRVADAKADQRARREAQARRTLILRVVAVVAVFAILIGGGIALYRSTFLTVDTVRTAGNTILSGQHLTELAAVPEGATMLNLKKDEIVARLESDPYVRSARVDRILPSTVVLRVEERVPIAALQVADGSEFLVDAEGYWLSPASAEQTATLAVVRELPALEPRPGEAIADPVATNALRIVRGLSPELREMTAYINAPSIERTEIITREGIAIFLGSSDQLAVKDEVARRILAENPGKVVYINVRIVDRPTWRGL